MKPAAATRPPPVWHDSPTRVALLLAIVVALAWANSLRGPFVFDDTSSLVENQSIRSLSSLAWLHPPHAAGETVGGRPVLNFTFALNYALSGLDVWSYHALNLLIHAGAAFTLWLVLRRLPPVRPGVALAAALLWAVHPLQTSAVTYVVQRAESLSAFFILLTVLGYLRYATATESARTRWATVSLIACLAGVGTKETVAVAPVLCLLLDGALLASGFRAAWRRNHRLLLALFGTWLLLGALVWSNHGRGGSAGCGAQVDVATYALTQLWALARYLRLTIWPAELTFDYGMLVVREPADLLVPALLVLSALAAVVLALRRRHPAGVAGAIFFLLLAPTSSVVPVATQTVAEHRVYLALAPALVLLCAAAARGLDRARLPQRVSLVLVVFVAGLLVALTFTRNTDYRTARSLWADTVAERPENPRARHNLGLALLAEGRRDEAIQQFQHAIRLLPPHALAHFQLGVLALTDGDWPTAQLHFAAALAADPGYVDARVNLAQTHARAGRIDAAIAEYRTALAQQPAADIRTNLAALYLQLGRFPEAERELQQALAESPELPEAHFYLARLRERSGAAVAAEEELRAALRYRPTFAAAAYALGNLLARQQRFDDAIAAYRIVLATTPAEHQARNNLANCYLALGRFREAIAEYEIVLAARPQDASVRENLAVAREMAARQ